jgi:hypothetical protein
MKRFRLGVSDGLAASKQLKLSPRLQTLVGNQYCPVEELLQRLVAKGDAKLVDTITVEVQTLSGEGFDVTLDAEENSVRVLKSKIETREGISTAHQELFVVKSSVPALQDSDVITGNCKVTLCVNPQGNVHSVSQILKTLSLAAHACQFSFFKL